MADDETRDRKNRARRLIGDISWSNPEAGQKYASQLDTTHDDDLGGLLNRLYDHLNRE